MISMPRRALTFALLAAVAATTVAAATIQPNDDPATSLIWQKVRASVFQERAITPAPPGMLSLEAPARAIDAAVVPISIRLRAQQTPARFVSKVFLIIDANPSPISAIFSLTPESGRVEIETRVRVDDYSHVRAVAEMNDGQLFATTRFVKASGGCSAPAGSDAQTALASLGKMHVRVEGDLNGREPVRAEVLIKHPNHSGLAMDQFTRQFTPAHFIRKVNVDYAGQPVFAADVDFSISENPNFRFYFQPKGPGSLKITASDSQGREFEHIEALRTSTP
jgi:sulfur-oxidizing protein SoxY